MNIDSLERPDEFRKDDFLLLDIGRRVALAIDEIRPLPLKKSRRLRSLLFAHPEPYVFAYPALPSDFSAVMGNDPPYFVEFVRFDHELKGFSRRQHSET
jgi:hypothetical protein